ncbi:MULTISPECIES: replication restart helicase PriA [Prochlorococcus]|uniref:Replication restart protein PriA n=1 Tax=Prochlorococcus marinus (strain SARG / CCMP1375 / SS120) TaxID=167539 RepID=Q7VD86_PROMA|nr:MULTISPECIES: primosomal protein N' [Prochlorococcus]AAP99542.1 Primosomal protein N' (replication factor Y) - superfamily II helicase [Prochlorococcus marinus subsp. marinus str. CCMP1375]KGG11185.1 Helicase PriA essential for oriC/DnaA-independent DNA replication [Prochlorococcus marinus str. LG]KGG21523.1 Helicase PriA essential for oriC/DnaA-independent DNA replication [Prochlorococcus marinus str. SS2]KGG23132.1 Helicase PriA essential for oriC/DnaA-independent DNA replication [Prochlor
MSTREIDVWLDVGREGRCFTYKDGKHLGVAAGDIVLVRLKGRSMHGLVVTINERRSFQENSIDSDNKKIILTNIEAVLQKAAVEPTWKEWLDATAAKCHISSFKMLKTALPPGWLGQKKNSNAVQKNLWWITLKNLDSPVNVLSTRQQDLQSALLKYGGGAWQKTLLLDGFSLGFIKGCLQNGLITRQKRLATLDKNKDSIKVSKSFVEKESVGCLTDEQEKALKLFGEIPPGSALLLWGVTGSGKTEVYLQMAANVLSEGRHCLILAPEIGLIPQLVDRCSRRFGANVLEYHSGCSEKQRVSVWRDSLMADKPVVVVGTRSSIFLPLFPLGLIVLDEEHDSSYKQESPMPCYHTKDLALDRARRTGAKVVLGSATPALSTWKDLKPEGPIHLARLTSRIAHKPLPAVVVVDMRQELADGHRQLLSRPLIDRLALLPEKNEQAVILVPRRGYSSFLSCRSCGDVVQCPNCDVSLTVHQGRDGQKWLRCHWCDYRASVQMRCKECGSDAFKPFGAGTQRVMENLEAELKGLRLLRFDRDTTRGRDGHRRLLEKFAAGEADVLIGTQMLAKGMDLPKVTLAVVLAADGLLHRPDLFAEEQSLQLFMQLAGRAGRGEKPGKVLIQTYSPEHPVILHLVDGSYESFLKKESDLRKDAGLVPYSRACLLRLSGESAALTATSATAVAEIIRPLCEKTGWSLLGPSPALIEKVAGKSRWQLLLHGPALSPLPLPSGNQLWRCIPKDVNLSIDPDPIQL